MPFITFKLCVLALTLVPLLPVFSSAQSESRVERPERAVPNPESKKPGYLGSPEEEMLRRAEIRHEEENHKEMVERADEVAQLGDEILTSFKQNNSLTRDDLKKLERLEKLARKIRGGAGGSDDKETLPDPPGKIEGAVKRLAEISGVLKKSVQKTSRLVISAAVIERSNDVIELVRHIRSITQP